MGNSTTGHMGMVRETECSLNISATLENGNGNMRMVRETECSLSINATLENPPIRHLRQQVSWFEDHLTDRV